jgi:hypothetical protein
VNFMLHACGWLEGGLVSSPFEKFVIDADQLGALHKLAQGVDIDENAQAMDASARSVPAAITSAAPTPRPISNRRSGAPRAGLQAVRDLGRRRRRKAEMPDAFI